MLAASFEESVDELENNEGFITETVDENGYFDYIDYLKDHSTIHFETN